MQLAVGATLQSGKYRIEQELGSGGFGTTYRATEVIATRPSLETRIVVIKEYLPRAIVQRETGSSRLIINDDRRASFDMGLGKFVREGRILLEIAHPHIVRVYQVFEEHDTAYLVMEYLPGGSLENALRKSGGRLDEAGTRGVMDGLVSALTALHRHEPPILHLDIKPQNVMFRANGTPVLIDFGAARQDQFNTHTNHAFTLNFAPPELMSQKSRPGPESDVYEMGVLLHLLLTGQLPPNAIDRASKGEWVPVGIPEPWNRLIGDALILHQDRRPKGIRAWWERAAPSESPTAETRPRPAETRKAPPQPATPTARTTPDPTHFLEESRPADKPRAGIPPLAWAGLGIGVVALAGIGFALVNPSRGQSVAASPSAVPVPIESPTVATPTPTPNPEEVTSHLVAYLNLVAQNKAISPSNDAAIRKAIGEGADINVQNDDRATALHLAVALNSSGLVDYLLARKPNLEAKNVQGYTPLHMAAFNNRPQLVRKLVAAGAKRDARDNDGQTPMDFAQGLHFADVIAALH